MLAFKYVSKLLASLGLQPNQPLLNGRVLCDFFVYFLNFCSCIMFVLLEANTFWEYTNSIFISMAAVVAPLLFILLIVNSTKIFKLLEIVQKFLEDRTKYSALQIIYIEKFEQTEKWSEIVDFVIARFMPIAFMIPKPMLSYFTYFTTDLGNDAFELAFPNWTPYDWRHPVGYAVTTLLSFAAFQQLFAFFGMTAAFGTSFLLFGIAIVRDMKAILKSTNNNAVAGDENKLQALKKLYEFIELHTMVKEMYHQLSDIVESFAIVVFASSLATICCAMLLIQMELASDNNDHNLLMLLIAIVYGVYAFGVVFILCEIAQHAGDAVNAFDMEIAQIDWYLYTIEMKKMLPIIMNMAQKPVELKWFGSMACNRDTFKKIANKGYSFYMVLREFSK